MSEVLNALCDVAFDTLHLTTIEAYTEDKNQPCQSLLKKCGFAETGTVDDIGYIQQKTFHMIIYSKTKAILE